MCSHPDRSIFFFSVGLSPQQPLVVKAECGCTLLAGSSTRGASIQKFHLGVFFVSEVAGTLMSSCLALASPGTGFSGFE